MTDWPPIDNQRTRERLAMDDAAFAELALRLARRIGGASFTDAHYERAIGYPWHPIAGGHGFALDADGTTRQVGPDDRVRAEQSLADGRLYPLVAIGSNASPETLATKLAGLGEPSDREVIAIPATLNDVKIGFSAHLAVYGSLPATLAHAPGEQTNATMLLVTRAQLSQIADGEFNYLLARFDSSSVECEIPFGAHPLAFVSRHGAVADRGEAMDLRTVTQADALEHGAGAAIGPAATARDLVRATIESYEWAVGEARPRLAEVARPLDPTFWDLHPGG